MSEANAISLVFIIMIMVIVGISILTTTCSYIFTSVAKMKCMKKAGEKGWKGWVPFYDDFIMYKIVGLNGFWVLIRVFASIISLIEIISIIVMLFMLKDDLQVYMEDYNYNSSSIESEYNISTSKSSNSSEVMQDARYYLENDLMNQPKYTLISAYFSIINLVIRVAGVAMFVLRIFFAIKIAKAFDLKGGYVAGVILLPTIFLLIIGFGKSKYVGDYKAA